MEELSDYDKQLIRLALKLPWEDIIDLCPLAESEQCKRKLKDILTWRYHGEEARDGNI